MKELLFFLLGCFLSLFLQAQSLSTDCNQLRGGDRLMKRMVTACEPGENGVQRVWDFGGLELRDANYELKYVLQGTDTVIGTEHCTMYYYRTSGDSLFCLGYENPTTFIAYQKPELLLVFPVFQGRVVTDYFDGMGNYCERLEVWLRGKSTVTADASGVLILPGGDTLRKVLRTYTHKCIYQRMIPKVAIQDSLQIDTIPFVLNRDSIEYLLTNDSIRLETETWRWYADGYRYPVFETVKSTVTSLVMLMSISLLLLYIYPRSNIMTCRMIPIIRGDVIWQVMNVNGNLLIKMIGMKEIMLQLITILE